MFIDCDLFPLRIEIISSKEDIQVFMWDQSLHVLTLYIGESRGFHLGPWTKMDEIPASTFRILMRLSSNHSSSPEVGQVFPISLSVLVLWK